MTSAVSAAVQQEVPLRAIAVELLLDGGAVRANSSLASLWIGGNEYLGVGTLGSVSEISEESEVTSSGLSVRLSGVPGDMIAEALTEPYSGRPATLWEVLFDRDTGLPLADPVLMFKGRIDQMNVEAGETATVEVTLEDAMADLDRSDVPKYTDEEQQRAYPGDLGMSFVPAVVEKDVIWPAGSFWNNSASRGKKGK